MDSAEPFIAHTHADWFDYLSTQAINGRLDEVNFWFPTRQNTPKRFAPGAPVFFRLGKPHRKIVGYGFFASFQLVPLSLAWETFATRNGAPDRSTFYTRLDRMTSERQALPLACMVLLDAHFWPDPRWIPWGRERGYADATRTQVCKSGARRPIRRTSMPSFGRSRATSPPAGAAR